MSEHDTDQLDELRAAGARLRNAAAATSTGNADAVMQRGRARRRRNTMSVAIAGALSIALAIAAVVTIASNRHDGRRTIATSPSTTVTTKPKPSPIDEQLAASLGDGVPKGWVPVDLGNARLWVPPTAQTASVPGPGCDGSVAGLGARTIVFGTLTANGCNADPGSNPWIRISSTSIPQTLPLVLPTTTIPSQAPLQRQDTVAGHVHGYTLWAPSPPSTTPEYDVPDLGIVIQYSPRANALITQVIHTLAPSASAIAARLDLHVDTSSWRTVRYGAFEWRQPATWKVLDRSGLMGNCRDTPAPRTSEVGSYVGLPGCPFRPPSYAVTAPADGLSVDAAPDASGPFTIVRNGSAITVTPGVDGRIAGAIFRSITPPIANSPLRVEGCPATVPQALHTPAGGTAQLVPGAVTTVNVCRYHGSNIPTVQGGALAAFTPGNAATLAHTLNALAPEPNARIVHCPAGDAAAVVLRFNAAAGHTFDVVAQLSGCRFITNGARTARVTTTVAAQLYDLVGGDCTFIPNETICGPPALTP